MSKRDVFKVINAALKLEEGEFIPLEFSTRGARESFRVQFSRERQKLLDYNPSSDISYLYCKSKVIGLKHYLVVKKGEKEVFQMSEPVIYNPKTGQIREVEALETDIGVEYDLPFKPTELSTHGSRQQDEMLQYMRDKYCNSQANSTTQEKDDYSDMTPEELEAYIKSSDSDLEAFKEEAKKVE